MGVAVDGDDLDDAALDTIYSLLAVDPARLRLPLLAWTALASTESLPTLRRWELVAAVHALAVFAGCPSAYLDPHDLHLSLWAAAENWRRAPLEALA